MEKKRKKISLIAHCIALMSFTLMAMASSSSKGSIDSQEFRDGFERGWDYGTEIGKSIRGDVDRDFQLLEVDSLSNGQYDIAAL